MERTKYSKLRREVGVFKKYKDSQCDDCSEQGENIKKQERQEKQAAPAGHNKPVHVSFRNLLYVSRKQWECWCAVFRVSGWGSRECLSQCGVTHPLYCQGIVNEVRQSMQLMLSQLIQQLRTNIQLPACLRVIGFLRRMDVFTEAELRVKFLQARDAWLRSILTSIPNDDPYFHITKTIEACRVHLFDIITQYRAIFSDEDPLLSPATGEHTVNESAIFHGWVLQKVSQFLQVLETDLHRGIGGRLDSLLGQCMYFGLSFSRVGADFRGQLAPVFQRVAISTFQKAIQEAVEKFQDEMNSYTLISAPAILGSSNLPAAVPVTQPGTLQPPMVLLDFPPLACFLNNILVAFNDLRLCCPIALAQDVTVTLEDALAKVSTYCWLSTGMSIGYRKPDFGNKLSI